MSKSEMRTDLNISKSQMSFAALVVLSLSCPVPASAESASEPTKLTPAEAIKKFPLFKSDFEKKADTSAVPSIGETAKKKTSKTPQALEFLKKTTLTDTTPDPSKADAKTDDEKLVQSEEEKLMKKKTAASGDPEQDGKPRYRKKIRSTSTKDATGAQLKSAFSEASGEAGTTEGTSEAAAGDAQTSAPKFRIPR